jgi:hypothetical protein
MHDAWFQRSIFKINFSAADFPLLCCTEWTREGRITVSGLDVPRSSGRCQPSGRSPFATTLLSYSTVCESLFLLALPSFFYLPARFQVHLDGVTFL